MRFRHKAREVAGSVLGPVGRWILEPVRPRDELVGHLAAADEVLGVLGLSARANELGVLVFELPVIPIKVAMRRPDREEVMKCSPGEIELRQRLDLVRKIPLPILCR